MITREQIRAARAWLNLGQQDIAKGIGVSAQTISDIENERTNPKASILDDLQHFFEMRGIEFLPEGGITPRALKTKYLKGTDGFRELMDDVYEQASTVGGKIRLWNAKPSNWTKWLGDDWYAAHTKRMQSILTNISFNVTCKEGDTNFIGGKHSEYRWVPEKMFNEQSIYCFGDRIAFMNFEEDSVNIYVLYNRSFSDSFKLLFDLVWDEITIIPTKEGYKP